MYNNNNNNNSEFMKKIINTILSSGGGSRGICYIGVFKKIEELIESKKSNPDSELPLIDIKKIVGVSVGTIFNLVYLLGYTSNEMSDTILNKKLEQLKDIRFFNLLSGFGLDSGEKVINWIKSLMKAKDFDPNITFKELFIKTGIDYQAIATNLNKYKFTIFSTDTTPDVKVTDGIRMSIGVPFIFTVVKYNELTHKVGNGDSHVDGGLINSYPAHLFKDSLDTFLGLKLISHGELEHHDVNEKVDDIENYIYNILACFMVQRDKHVTMTGMYNDHTVYIHTEDLTQTINFSLKKSDKQRLIDMGYNAASKYFNC
jgi:predicted acylesterase/phospholipase RssA